jgi:hypothetical protein
MFTYSYTEVDNYFTDPLTRERVGAFIDRFQRKQTAYEHTYGEQFTGVYFDREELRLLLGRHTYVSTLTALEDFGFSVTNETSKYGKRLFFFKPLEYEFKGKRVPVKGSWLKKNLGNLNKLKKKRLSSEARLVYNNLKHLEYTCTEDEFKEAIEKHYPTYVEEKTAIGKPALRKQEYVMENMGFYGLIERFGYASGTERVDYIWEDSFGGRVHSILSCTPNSIKEGGYIRLKGQPVVRFDLHQSQPTILAKTLEECIGKNDFSETFDSVPDIYEHMQSALGLSTRAAAKETVFRLLYGKPDHSGQKKFNSFFPQAGSYISELKKMRIADNPSRKIHSNLCWMMQRKETEMFRAIWRRLNEYEIVFIPVHDEIIAPGEQEGAVYYIMHDELEKHLKKFRIKYKLINPK